MTDRVSLAAGKASVVIAPRHGAALVAFSFGGRAVLRPTPREAALAGDPLQHACYPLVPFANRVARAKLEYAGHQYALRRHPLTPEHALHGCGWQRPWHVLARDTTSTLLALDHRPDPEATGPGAKIGDWPWPFAARLGVWLVADPHRACLRMRLTLRNPGADPYPFGLGFHPFFTLGSTTELAFRAATVWETDPLALPVRAVPVDGAWRFDPARSPAGTALDNAYAGWEGEARLHDRGDDVVTTLRADSTMTFLQAYTPAGADFIALEPTTHLPDGFNRAARGLPDTGTRDAVPGGSFSCTMEIACHLP